MYTIKLSQNHLNQTKLIVFYCEIYDDKERRGLPHEEQKNIIEKHKKQIIVVHLQASRH